MGILWAHTGAIGCIVLISLSFACDKDDILRVHFVSQYNLLNLVTATSQA